MDELKELHSRLTEMLEWFHSFCLEHGLCYYVIGGTMLGAARHQGFVPWDDDIDIGMPTEDYARLKRAMRGLQGRYQLETPQSRSEDFFYPFCKLYDTTTTFIEKSRINTKRGIYLDIFPLDGAGETLGAARRYYARIDFWNKLRVARILERKEERGFVKEGIVGFAQSLPFSFVHEKKLAIKIEKICSQRRFEDYKYVGALAGGAWGSREIISRDSFGVPTLYRFEGLMVYGVEKPDAYLTALYGNWRKLPPAEKRVSHHTATLIDLNVSYLDVEQDGQ